MDYEYDDEPLEGRILWGRIAVYGMAFVLIFLLGSCFGSRGAPSDAEVEELSERVRDLASENEVLEQQLEAASAGSGQDAPTDDGGGADGAEPTATPDTGADGETEGGEGETGNGEGGEGDGGDAGGEVRIYQVESGDNLYTIAQELYGDGNKWRLIAEENGLDASNPLTVGQELRIPPGE